MPTNGLVVMTPTTVAKTGASSTATINGDGSVTFGSCETLSLNGVFTSDYDNYMVTIRYTSTNSSASRFRLRASGADNSTANSYVSQVLLVNNTSVSTFRITADYGLFGAGYNESGDIAYFYGPYLAQPTATRNTNVLSASGGIIYDVASTHNQSISYDGITIIEPFGLITGLVTVFGFNQ